MSRLSKSNLLECVKAAPLISVVIPAHNEVGNIAPLVDELRETLECEMSIEAERYEILVVDDGSSDGTAEIVAGLVHAGLVRGVRHRRNRGYGAALRSGFNAARGEYVAFIDGDRQLVPGDLSRLLPFASRERLALGYRAKRDDPWYRVILGKIFSQVFVPLAIGVRVRDVDCALKVFPRRLLDFADLRADGALINAELLATAKHLGYEFAQIAVQHRARVQGEQSGAKLSVILKVFSELMLIRKRVKALEPRAMFQTNTQISAPRI